MCCSLPRNKRIQANVSCPSSRLATLRSTHFCHHFTFEARRFSKLSTLRGPQVKFGHFYNCKLVLSIKLKDSADIRVPDRDDRVKGGPGEN